MYEPQSEWPVEPSDTPSRKSSRTLLWLGLILGGLFLLLCVSVGVVLIMFLPSTGLPRFAGFVPDGSAPVVVPAEQAIRAGKLPPPPESPRATAESTPLGLVRISDDFDQPTTGWDQSLNRVVDGTYELRVDTPNYDSYGLYLGDGAVRNFDLTVDVQQVVGDPTAEYGIRFRQSGPGDYLMFAISGSGYYRLVRVVDDEYQTVVPWTYAEQIRTGADATNQLRVQASDENIQAFVNGQEVLAETDTIAAAGQLTFGVTTFDQGGLVVRFDNVTGEVEGLPVEEDFSDAEDVPWSIGGATIRNGVYELFAGGGIRMWQQPLPPGASEVEDFVLEVDATLLSGGGEDLNYGVMFGDGGAFDFYSLLLFADGSVMLTYADGRGQTFALLPRGRFKAIKSGTGETNHIRVELRNDVIRIAINDEELPEMEAVVPIEGQVGLIVSSGDGESIQAGFDNFSLEELAAEEGQF